jgi:hypothetical protein
MSEQPKRRGAIFWIIVLAGAAVVLFVGSAMVAGIMEFNEGEDARKKSASLSSISVLQNMILSGAKSKSVPLSCWYVGAIGFRLAEARDLKIPKAYAIDLANDEHLVGELAKSGFNAKHVIGGIATHVYDSPLPPSSTFETQLEACSRGRP